MYIQACVLSRAPGPISLPGDTKVNWRQCEIGDKWALQSEAGGKITNRWSCRLRWSSGSKECRRCGSLRAGDSAALLNSMLNKSLELSP